MRHLRILLLLGALLLAETLSPVALVPAGMGRGDDAGEGGLVAPGFTGVVVGGPIWFSAPSLSGKVLLAASSWGLRAYDTGSLEELWWVFRGIPVYGAALDDEKGLLVALTTAGLEAYNTSDWGLLWVNPGINSRSLSVSPLETVEYMSLSAAGLAVLVLKNWSMDRGYSHQIYVVDAGSGVVLYNRSVGRVEDVEWSPTRPVLAYTDGRSLVLVDFSSPREPETKTIGLGIAKDVSWDESGARLCVARGPYGVSLISPSGTRLAAVYTGLPAEKVECAAGEVIAASENYVGRIGLNGTIEWLSPPLAGTVAGIHRLGDGRTAVLTETYTREGTVLYLLDPKGQLEKARPLYARGLEATVATPKGLMVVTRARILSIEPGFSSAPSVESYRHGIPLTRDTILVNATTVLEVVEEPLGVSKGYEIAYHRVGGSATGQVVVVGEKAPQVLYTGPSFTSLFLGEGYIAVYSQNGTLEWARYIGSPLYYKAVWSSNGRLLAVLEPYRGELQLFNRSGALLASETYSFRSTVYWLAFSPNARYLALIGFRDIYILDTGTLKKIMTISGVRAEWSRPPVWDWGNRLWVRTGDTLLLVDPAANTTKVVRAPRLSRVEDIAPSPRGDLVAAVGYRETRTGTATVLVVFNPAGEKLWEKVISENTYPKSIHWSDKGGHVVLLTSYEGCLGSTAYAAVYSAKTGVEAAKVPGEYCKAAYFDKEQVLALQCRATWMLYSVREKRFLGTVFPANRVTGAGYTSRGAYISIATPGSKEKYQWVNINPENGTIEAKPAKTWFDVAAPSGDRLIRISSYCMKMGEGYRKPAAALEAYTFKGDRQWALGLGDTVDPDEAFFLPNKDIMILIAGNGEAAYHVDYDNGTILGKGEYGGSFIKAVSGAGDRIAYGYPGKVVVVDQRSRKIFEKTIEGRVIDVSLDGRGELLAVIKEEQREKKLLVYSTTSHALLLASQLPGRADHAIWSWGGSRLAVVDEDHHLLVLQSPDWSLEEYPLPAHPRASLVPTLVHRAPYTGLWNSGNTRLAVPSLRGVSVVPVSGSGKSFFIATPYEPMDLAWDGGDALIVVGELGVDVYNLTRLLDVKVREAYRGVYYRYRDNIYTGENGAIIVGRDSIAVASPGDNTSLVLENVFPRAAVSPRLDRLYIYFRDAVYWAPIEGNKTVLHPLYYARTGSSIHGLYAITVPPDGGTLLLLLLYKGVVAIDDAGKTRWSNWDNDLRGFKEVEWSPKAGLVMVEKQDYPLTKIIFLDAISGEKVYATSLEGYLVRAAWLGETLYLQVYLETGAKGELRVYHVNPHAKTIERMPGAVSAAGSPSGNTVAILYRNGTILVLRATGEKRVFTATGFHLLCCISNDGGTVYGYTQNILTGLDTATGRQIVYGDHNPITILELRDGEIAVSSSYTGLYTAKPALWAPLYILPPQTLLTLTIANKTIDLEKGLRLHVKPGNITLAYKPRKPLAGLEALGSPEWYTRLTITTDKTVKAFIAAVEKPPTAKDFEKRLGRLTLDATRTKHTAYVCNITWAENGLQQVNLSSGDMKSYPALPGTYKVKCVYSRIRATGKAETYQEKVTVEQGREAALLLPQARPPATTTTATTPTTTISAISTTSTTKTTTTTTTKTATTTTTITTTQAHTTTQPPATTAASTTETITTAPATTTPATKTTTTTPQTTGTATPTATTTQQQNTTTQKEKSTTTLAETGKPTPTAYTDAAIIAAILMAALIAYAKWKKNR